MPEAAAKPRTRTELWERLWANYVIKLARYEDLEARGRYGYQLRMPGKAIRIARDALLKEFPEAEKYVE